MAGSERAAVVLGNILGNKLSETENTWGQEVAANTGFQNRQDTPPAGWGPGGRRFKSCLPD